MKKLAAIFLCVLFCNAIVYAKEDDFTKKINGYRKGIKFYSPTGYGITYIKDTEEFLQRLNGFVPIPKAVIDEEKSTPENPVINVIEK